MSALSAYSRRILREQGRMKPWYGGKPLRSWAVIHPIVSETPWYLEPGQSRPGTKPGHRRQRRLFRKRYGWYSRNWVGSLKGGAQ